MFIDEVYINVLLGFLSALLVCGLFFWWYYIKKEREFQKLRYESRGLVDRLQEQKEQNHSLTLTLSTYKERLEQMNQSKLLMKEEFENIAHHILRKNSADLTQQNSHNLHNIIHPFKEDMQALHTQLAAYYDKESKERFSLTKEVKQLQQLNQQISQDAHDLTNALKGNNKLQGDWGEMVLERVLESSGLKRGREYLIQPSFNNKKGERFRPDVLIKLPENRDVIIDSKVSLKSYENYYHDRENQSIKPFINSIHTHIKQLSNKSYQNLEGLDSLDLVLMFVPIEGALLLAQEHDNNLFMTAYQKNIFLVSPSTLLPVLRIIENSWRIEYQNKNAKVIAKKAGEMYDKFSNFVLEMQKIDTALHKAQDAYDDAFKKLSNGKGNLMQKAQDLKSLEGVVHTKEIKENTK